MQTQEQLGQNGKLDPYDEGAKYKGYFRELSLTLRITEGLWRNLSLKVTKLNS